MNKAYQYSIRLIAMRDYSRYKLQQKLLEREFSIEDIESAIAKLIEQKYLQEDEYIRVKIKTYLQKCYSRNYIIQKLKQEEIFISEDKIIEYEELYDLHTNENIKRLIEKKLRNKSIPKDYLEKMKLKKKIHFFLASKGYTQNLIESGLSQYFN